MFLNSCGKEKEKISVIKETRQDLEIITAYKEAYKALDENDPYFAEKFRGRTFIPTVKMVQNSIDGSIFFLHAELLCGSSHES